MKNKYQCLLLNADYTPIGIVNWQKAITLIYRNVVYTLKYHSKKVKDSSGREWVLPSVIVIYKYVHRQRYKVGLSTRNILLRDNYKCVYCGITLDNSNYSIDHVIPRSKGGKHIWTNVVSSCKRCNAKKGNKIIQFETPKEPKSYYGLVKDMPSEWKEYCDY